jgi:hypothetical protein
MVSEDAELASAGILIDSDLEHECAHDFCQSDKERNWRVRDSFVASPHWALALRVGCLLESGKRRLLMQENERQLDLPDARSGPCHRSQRRLSGDGPVDRSGTVFQISRLYSPAIDTTCFCHWDRGDTCLSLLVHVTAALFY